MEELISGWQSTLPKILVHTASQPPLTPDDWGDLHVRGNHCETEHEDWGRGLY